MFSADGNVLFRRTVDGYELWDPDNTFLTNPTAKTVNETAIIERFYLTQSQLRAKDGIYKNIEAIIRDCGGKVFKKEENTTTDDAPSPMYELYRRTGEISEAQLFKAQGKKGGKEDKYVLARIIVAGLGAGKSGEYVLFAEKFKDGETMSDYYKEAHRGPYKGRWWREGMYELLFDHQVRGNEIGTQIARGLEWAGKVLFTHTDVQTLQNVRTALNNGSLIKSADLSQIEVRLQGFDQLIADWNRINTEADKIANSYEVIQGGSLPAQTPFGLGRLMDQNANKLYALLRQKLSIAYKGVFKEFVLPSLVGDLKGEDIIRITGDARFLEEFYRMAANGWYMKNLAKIGPHTPEIAEQLKKAKMAELQQFEPLIKNTNEIWKGVLPRIYVTITGENYAIEEQETIATMLQFEQDPGRRAFLLDYIYRSKGVPVPPIMAAISEPMRGQPELPQPGAGTPEPVAA
jgi:hypothetical protein